MTGMDVLLFIGLFLLAVSVGYFVVSSWLGPDRDLDSPWRPGDR